MPPSVDVVRFRMSPLLDAHERDAVLSVTHAKSWNGNDGWRVVAKWDGEEGRDFGRWQP